MRLNIAQAINAQDSIGWDSAAHGLLSKQWSQIACQDILSTDRRDDYGGQSRMKTIITAVYEHSTRLWMSRNTTLHSNEDATIQDIRSVETAEIKALYRQPHLLKAEDRHYCDRSLDTLLTGPASTRRRWLRRVRKSIAEHKQDGGRQSLITSFFTTTTDA